MLDMYFTMTPLILGGIANMIFTKTKMYKKYKFPIDNEKSMKDGKRIFGDNKTWIGFFSMIFFCLLFQIGLGIICNIANLNEHCDWYLIHNNTLIWNIWTGILIGFVYMISELPNSFIKRRIGIRDGKTENGTIGKIFFVIDQIDSLIGVMLLLVVLSGITWKKYLLYLLLGAGTHILVNLILYKTKVRNNL